MEKVIKGLECCMSGQPDGLGCDRGPCPYNEFVDCEGMLHRDALALLKAQEPRVITLEEVRLLGKNAVVWYEYKSVYGQPRPKVVEFVFDEHITFTDGNIYSFSADSYGERWRLWTSRPDEKVRAETPWASDT